jgi:hypothetical protein
MPAAAVGENATYTGDHGCDQDDEPENDDHDALRKFVLLPPVNAVERVLSTSLTNVGNIRC